LDNPEGFLQRLSGAPQGESDVDKFLDDLFSDAPGEPDPES